MPVHGNGKGLAVFRICGLAVCQNDNRLVVLDCRDGIFQRRVADAVDLRNRAADDPHVAFFDSSLAGNDECGIRLAVKAAAGDQELGVRRGRDLGNIAIVGTASDIENALVSGLGIFAENQSFAGRDDVAFAHHRNNSSSILQPHAVAIGNGRSEGVVGEVEGSAAAGHIDKAVACRDRAVVEVRAGRSGKLSQAVQIRTGDAAECDVIIAGAAGGFIADNIQRRTRAREGASADRNVVGIVVLAGGVWFICILRARDKDKRIRARAEQRLDTRETDILDRQRLGAVGAAVAVDDDLTDDGLSIAVNNQVQIGLLTYDRVAGNIRDEGDCHVAGHLMRRVEGILQRGIQRLADLRHGRAVGVRSHAVFHACDKRIAGGRVDRERMSVQFDLQRLAGRHRVRFVDVLQKRDDRRILSRSLRCIGKACIPRLADLRNGVSDDPHIAALQSGLVRSNYFGIRFNVERAAGDEAGLRSPGSGPFIEGTAGNSNIVRTVAFKADITIE